MHTTKYPHFSRLCQANCFFLNPKPYLIFLQLTLILGILSFYFSYSYASFEDLAAGSKSNSLAGAFIAMIDVPEAIYVNAAGLCQISTLSGTIYYARPFGLKDLAYTNLYAVIPFKGNAIGCALHSYGNTLYRETIFSFAFSHRFTKQFMVGTTLNYDHLYIHNYGDAATLELDVGLLTIINHSWKWGLTLSNLNRATVGHCKEFLPQTFHTGLTYNFHDNISLNFDLYKDVHFPLDFRYGFEVWPIPNLSLRCGIGTMPSRIAAGIGLKFLSFEWDYAFLTHSDLGVTHQISISFFKKQGR